MRRAHPAAEHISIHASHEGSDTPSWAACIMAPRFQSTLPAREATKGSIDSFMGSVISIHASREGSDKQMPTSGTGQIISIHASREGSDEISLGLFLCVFLFQSTLPAREATVSESARTRYLHISIHASREGSDSSSHLLLSALEYFNPRFPRGKRRRSVVLM